MYTFRARRRVVSVALAVVAAQPFPPPRRADQLRTGLANPVYVAQPFRAADSRFAMRDWLRDERLDQGLGIRVTPVSVLASPMVSS